MYITFILPLYTFSVNEEKIKLKVQSNLCIFVHNKMKVSSLSYNKVG